MGHFCIEFEATNLNDTSAPVKPPRFGVCADLHTSIGSDSGPFRRKALAIGLPFAPAKLPSTSSTDHPQILYKASTAKSLTRSLSIHTLICVTSPINATVMVQQLGVDSEKRH
jgi:hypothetical protein